MRPTLVVFDSPSFDSRFGFVNRLEPVQVQALVAERAIEAFDKRVVSWLARPTEVDLYAMMVSPQIHEATRELTAVINENSRGCAARRDQTIADIDNVLAAKAMTDSDSDRFSSKYVEHGQRADPSAVDELIGHKVHRPRLVGSLRHVAFTASDDHLATPRALAAQLQVLLGV